MFVGGWIVRIQKSSYFPGDKQNPLLSLCQRFVPDKYTVSDPDPDGSGFFADPDPSVFAFNIFNYSLS